jgi:holo-[acyl-carrier protein] synthase
VVGIGIDAVEVPRFHAVTARRPSVLSRIFTDAERAGLAARADPGPGLAARFAAKEAVMKALGVGIGAFAWHDVEVVGVAGPPSLRLRGRAAELAAERGAVEWLLSLTHTNQTAVAVALAVGAPA